MKIWAFACFRYISCPCSEDLRLIFPELHRRQCNCIASFRRFVFRWGMKYYWMSEYCIRLFFCRLSSLVFFQPVSCPCPVLTALLLPSSQCRIPSRLVGAICKQGFCRVCFMPTIPLRSPAECCVCSCAIYSQVLPRLWFLENDLFRIKIKLQREPFVVWKACELFWFFR